LLRQRFVASQNIIVPKTKNAVALRFQAISPLGVVSHRCLHAANHRVRSQLPDMPGEISYINSNRRLLRKMNSEGFSETQQQPHFALCVGGVKAAERARLSRVRFVIAV